MKISFVILTWNRYQFLEKCLEALLLSIKDPSSCEILIMDNGSDDATSSVLQCYENHQQVKIFHLKKNYGIGAYKKLFAKAKGKYIVIVDDDVLAFPEGLDEIFSDYMMTYPDYGFIALNVIQNEFTNGAKPGPEHYINDTRSNKSIELGPTGGWCTSFRATDYKKIKWRFLFSKLSMKMGEDGMLSALFAKKLHLKSGIIKDKFCFHASGPHYARAYGHLDREIQKYKHSGLDDFVEEYKKYGQN
ncbi:glycosyltransferase [Pedobacter sp. MC2016-24]|uniref:glycosyltransferase n=1 Tax=Pedobacter sp. MC2016-24 TaxID=2780090 RepID=UPI001881511E|nr:glycosyltransferase [Pedobacter sp. MC2016-24]MBE9598800.1 glycosyltransferase family 2 protein [Pedobacter sp. MC2016-24]